MAARHATVMRNAPALMKTWQYFAGNVCSIHLASGSENTLRPAQVDIMGDFGWR